jgi:hypothetical protein
MPTHLLPSEILEWSRVDSMPENALDVFLENRVDLIVEDLKKKLPLPKFEVIYIAFIADALTI